MRLSTDFREEATGVLQGTKHYYLICRVDFSEEEKSVIQARGMYDVAVEVPAETPPPTRAGDFVAMLLRMVGIVCIPLGFLASCVTGLAHQSSTAGWFLLFMIGIVLFVVGKLKDRAANRREKEPDQTLTIKRLLTNPEFKVHAPTIQIAKTYEDVVRHQLGVLAQEIRESTAAPEKNAYEL